MDGFIDRFLAAHDVKPVSRDGYRSRLKQFFRWCHDRNLHRPDRESILQYKRELEQKQSTPFTISAYLTAIRCFFAWAESTKLHPNVARSIKGPKKQRGFRRDPLTVAQVHELLGSIERATLKGKRDYALINLLIRTGLRSIELQRAHIEDMRVEGGRETVLWVQGKGQDSKDAFVVLTEETLAPIQDYLAARGPTQAGEPLFGSTSDGNRHARLTTRSIRRVVKERLRGIKLDSPRLSTHSCRHTMVTLALLAGAPIQEVQQLARHFSVDTTMGYAQNIRRSQGIPERAIAKLLAKT